MVAAVVIDARHCRGEICRCKHFRFRQKYRLCPQATAGIGIQFYRRRRQQSTYICPQLNTRWRLRPPQTLSISLQTHSQTLRRAFADASTLSTFIYASTNACTYAQQCADASANAFLCIHGNVVVRRSLLRCCAYNRFLSPVGGERWNGRGELLTVTPVRRTLSGPMLH